MKFSANDSDASHDYCLTARRDIMITPVREYRSQFLVALCIVFPYLGGQPGSYSSCGGIEPILHIAAWDVYKLHL